MATKKVLITGATGYTGGDVLHALNRAQPDWEYSVLVRSAEKFKAVQAKFPKVKPVIGSLDDSNLLREAASKADIVIHTADSSDHQGAARAIGAGLRSSHSRSNPGYWIHVSGAGILCWYDMQYERYGEKPLAENSYGDLEGVEKVTSLPDSALHRDVDQIVLAEAAKDPEAVKVAIVCPPTIYGPGRGSVNRKSRQIPSMIQTTLRDGFGPIVEAGQNECDNIHVQDLSDLLVLLALQSTKADQNDVGGEIWGPRGYYFAENGTHKWSAIAHLVAKEAYEQGLVSSSETKKLDLDRARQIHGFEALSWGLNSRGQAKRARKYLGWNPSRPSLEATIADSVRVEAEQIK